MYQPKRRSVEFKENPSGAAIAQLLKDGNLGIKFSESNENEFAGKKYRISAWPEYVNPQKLSGRTWYIRLDNDNKGIYSIAPQSGMFTGRVQRFTSQEGVPPTPKLKEYTYEGRLVQYYQFVVLIEIVDGDDACVGMTIPYVLRYNFGEDAEGNTEYTFWGKNSKHSPRLHEFLSLVGAWDNGAIKFSDNILPELQRRILKAAKTFKFVIKDGWIDTLYADQVSEVSEVAPWDDEEDWDNLDPTETSPKPVETESTEFDW